MSERIFDSNRFLMAISTLNVAAKHLGDEVQSLKMAEIEYRWKEILSTLHEYFAYAQSHSIDLKDYRNELNEIIHSLYIIEKAIQDRSDGRVAVLDDVAQGIIFISGKIDDVLEGIGWRRVVRPITEAIFVIPKKVASIFSQKQSQPKALQSTIQQYLPPPMARLSLPAQPPRQAPTKKNETIQVKWVEVETSNESYAEKVLRRMHDRISAIEEGDYD